MKPKSKTIADHDPTHKKYIVTVIVERIYETTIYAKSLPDAEATAAALNIQDSEDNWANTEVGDPIVELEE